MYSLTSFTLFAAISEYDGVHDGTTAAGDVQSNRPIYSIGAVARMVRVRPATIRSWEDRYALVTPERSTGGHRLYTRNQVEQLRFIKSQLDDGIPPATAHRLLADRLAGGSGFLKGDLSERPRLLILLVERDTYAGDLEEYFLMTEGYQVELVVDVEEAEQKAVELSPDLIVVELLISGGSGPDLCRRLKARTTGPLLAISSLAARDEALAAGADAFLQKPLDPLQFISATKDLLGASAFLGLLP
jgi:DNA-binding transcriptional MerR regulator